MRGITAIINRRLTLAPLLMAALAADTRAGEGWGRLPADGERPAHEYRSQFVYPREALDKRMVGWVILEFTVTETGRVQNPVVVEHCAWVQTAANKDEECIDSPSDIFDNAAIKEALRLNYKPQQADPVHPLLDQHVQQKLIEGGLALPKQPPPKNPPPTRAQHKFTFELSDAIP